MAKISILAISLALLLFHGTVLAQQQQQQQRRGECQLQRINAQEPNDRIQSEAGHTELWNFNDEQFQCAGVFIIRHNIQQKGLLLPSYTNTPLLVYIEQGRGQMGIMLPGCPETFQESQQSQGQQGQGQQSQGQQGQGQQSQGQQGQGQQSQGQQGQGQQSQGQGQGQRQDRHQRVQEFRKGDIIAIPAGAAHWTYNNGDNDLVAVVMHDTSNYANQLDQNPRRFFLAGNPNRAQQGQQQQQQWQGQQGQFAGGNIFRGLETRVLAEAFGVDEETARKLQGEEDQRGPIVRVERGLQTIMPPFTRQGETQPQQQQGSNGLEETICSAKYRENIDDPSRADVYNPRAGRFATLDSYNLPILRHLRLSASRGVLQRNAMMSPFWSVNSHTVMYVTRGDAKVQIVDHRGQAVFDGQVRQGQVIVAPMNFAVVKQAGQQGFEWVAFRTNDRAMINTLAGRTSAMRGLPVDVIANAYQISREQAQMLKFNREESLLFSGSNAGIRAVA